MGRPIKRKLPKKATEVEQLTDDEVIATIFGKKAQEALKRQALNNDDDTEENDTETTTRTT